MNWLKSAWRSEKLPPNAEVGFRSLCAEDKPAVKEITTAAMPMIYPDWWFEGFCQNPHNFYCTIGCFVDGNLVGFVVAMWNYYDFKLQYRSFDYEKTLLEEADGKVAYVSTLAVDSRFQRMGIASELMRLAVEKCATHESNPRLIYLHVHHANVSAQKIYEKMGFGKRFSNRDYYLIDGEEQEAHVFVKNFVD